MIERFSTLWKRLNAQGNAEQEFAKLNARYSEPHRFYHNMCHIRDCLSEFDSAKSLDHKADLVELAIWCHDAIYDTEAKDNEERSAQLAYDICIAANLPPELARRAKDLIIATKHNVVPIAIEARILIDVDLSVLGKPLEEFEEYERNIRKEYSWVPEDQFKQGRSAILQMFLGRESIYFTDFFKARYETQARRNLQMSIDALR